LTNGWGSLAGSLPFLKPAVATVGVDKGKKNVGKKP
jgi:hypothetical protein